MSINTTDPYGDSGMTKCDFCDCYKDDDDVLAMICEDHICGDCAKGDDDLFICEGCNVVGEKSDFVEDDDGHWCAECDELYDVSIQYADKLKRDEKSKRDLEMIRKGIGDRLVKTIESIFS